MGNLGKIGKPQKSKKHKKLKQCDPFYRGVKQSTIDAKSKDKTPKGNQLDEQEMSRSMREFMRNKKMMSENISNPKSKSQMKKRLRDKNMNEFQFKDDKKGMTRPMRPVPEFHRKKGERDFDLVRRADAAAQAVLGESRFEDKYRLNWNPTEEEKEEKKKKKEDWKEKKAARKEKRKKKRQGEDVSDIITNMEKKDKKEKKEREKDVVDFSDLKDEVAFGEVNMAPPTLTTLPRKAEKTDSRNNNLLLTSMMINKNNSKKAKGEKELKKTIKMKKMSALQKSNLMHEREKVVAQYRKLKAGNLGKLS